MSAYRTFCREVWRHYHTTGAIWPSGHFLANALTTYVRDGGANPDTPRRILEVGPGSGPVTQKLVQCLHAGDSLDLVEINAAFVAYLQGRFEKEPAFQAVANRVQIFHRPVEELTAREPYDLIISGLPLNNFTADEVDRILRTFALLLKPGGRLSFFEYIAIRTMRKLVSSKAERRRLDGVENVLTTTLTRGEVARQAIWFNVPPAWVHHVDLHRSADCGRRDTVPANI